MIKQYIITDDLKLVDAKKFGILKTFHDLVNKTSGETEDNDDEYIGVAELCVRFHCAPQTIYNKKRSGIWSEGVHYIKPSGGKLLFKWSAMKEWADGQHSVSAKRNTSPNQQSSKDNQSQPLTTSAPSSCAPNKDFVNI